MGGPRHAPKTMFWETWTKRAEVNSFQPYSKGVLPVEHRIARTMRCNKDAPHDVAGRDIGVYAGLIVNYSLNIIYVHIWCRLGLPSTVLAFIIVLWPIPGVYIIYQSASVRLWLGFGCAAPCDFKCCQRICLLGELIGDRWKSVNGWIICGEMDTRVASLKSCELLIPERKSGQPKGNMCDSTLWPTKRGVTVAALHCVHTWHNECGTAGHNVRLVGLECASRWGEAQSLGRVNGDRVKTGPGWRQCCAIGHLSLSTSCQLWH